MANIADQINELFKRIPRRHSADNVKEIYSLLDEYEDLLTQIEGSSSFYEKQMPPFFDAIEPIRLTIKKSSDNKAPKKLKDDYFDQGSGALKDSMEELIKVVAGGSGK